MRMVSLIAAAVLLVSTASQAGVLIPVPQVPGSVQTTVTAINNSNVITGWYSTPDFAVHGFVGTLDGQYQTFDYPSGQTMPFAINDEGYISGEGSPINGRIGDAFVRAPNGDVMAVTKDGVTLDGSARGFEGKTTFVGDYWTFDDNGVGTDHGYFGNKSKWQADIVLPVDTRRTSARDIDKKGRIVGYFSDPDFGGALRGFVLDGSTVTAVAYPDPRMYFTILEGMNEHEIAVGYWGGGAIGASAFAYDIRKQKFTSINVPLVTTYNIEVTAGGINDAGLVAVEADAQPYVYCLDKQTCPSTAQSFDVPTKWTPAPADAVRNFLCIRSCLRRRVTPSVRTP